jgi:hypothetical protein
MTQTKFTRYFNKEIQTWDDVWLQDELYDLVTEIQKTEYYYGVTDFDGAEPSGMSTVGDGYYLQDRNYFKTVWNWMHDNIPEIRGYILDKHIVNVFAPGQNSYYHTDNAQYDSWTVIWYANTQWHVDEGGETKFILYTKDYKNFGIDTNEDREYPYIISVAPIPGRMLLFKGGIQHTATAMRFKTRFTPTWQFIKPKDGQTLPEIVKDRTHLIMDKKL